MQEMIQKNSINFHFQRAPIGPELIAVSISNNFKRNSHFGINCSGFHIDHNIDFVNGTCLLSPESLV